MLALVVATWLSGFDIDAAVLQSPALVVAVRHKDGRHEVRGYGTLDDGKAPDGDTAFEMGSITKTFTALLFARALVDGKIAPGTTLAHALGLPAPSPASTITLEQLATHTAGLARLPPNLASTDARDPYRDYTPALLIDALTTMSPNRGRGVVDYSNYGFGVLGYAVTKDRGYAKALVDDVTAPLALAHTRAFTPVDGLRTATPHDTDRKPTSPWHKTEALAGAGGIWSTAGDLLAVSDALLAAPHAAHPSPLERALVEVFTERVAAEKPLVGAPRPAIALAWHIRPDGIRWHNGGTGGTSTVWDVDPKTGCAVVVLANVADYNDDAVINRVLNACLAE